MSRRKDGRPKGQGNEAMAEALRELRKGSRAQPHVLKKHKKPKHKKSVTDHMLDNPE